MEAKNANPEAGVEVEAPVTHDRSHHQAQAPAPVHPHHRTRTVTEEVDPLHGRTDKISKKGKSVTTEVTLEKVS